jgi:hypothetical protein
MYVYIDMDQAVNSAIATSRRFIETYWLIGGAKTPLFW